MTDRKTRLVAHARAIFRIARWEVSRSAGTLDRKTVVLGLIAVLVAGGIAAGAAGSGAALDRDLYRVGIASDSPYYDAVDQSPTLDPRPISDPNVELIVTERHVSVADTRTGDAAYGAFRDAVQSYNERQMVREENQSAAFPVVVNLQYRERGALVPAGSRVDDSSGGAGAAGDGSGGSSGTDGTDGSGSSTGTVSGDGSTGAGTAPSDAAAADDGKIGASPLGGAASLFGGDTSGSPASINPPFPFASLVLAFVFLVPMNFVIQAYGSSILNERINRRGELLLVAPISPGDIVAGKTLPYLLGMVGITAAIAMAVGGGFVSVAAVVPIGLLFLAATFVGAMFARSFKELTFVTVTVSVFLTTYTFVPAIFTNVTPIALISPLTLVVRDLGGDAIPLGEFAFSVGPILLAAVVLFLLGIGVYREEDMFTQRSVPLKFLDALDSRISRPRSIASLSALSIPFVFIAELLAIAVLFVLPIDVTVPLILVAVAVVEELAKSLHVYAAFENARFARTVRTSLVLGGLSGLGFFVGEKFTAIAQIAGLQSLTLGQTAFAPAGVGVADATGISIVVAVGLLLAPLVLHAVTASVTALGASRGKSAYALSLVGAIGIHLVYNLQVVTALG
ncbi:ABC transporter permease [Haloferax mediterranei ATCC 33500]|uniref:ABC transporter permease n=1 Tax=Haloferax mediterranei (strain ATCC 33500 / DSM 1411 / JCM 8866 / NBRC 14739 / NCIMB 2177 / R-4) TaxID=523841 RepID=I3R4Q4_HALMT|nr:ABC transporter permease [Haloferax mediterranei]AFK19214.1 ABC-type transport system permease protein [Haloferax mediterranei ATCC 33500]AHZ21423.1 ABC transporter permease [Haloferax mediterranei ATCC 33500]EMA03882.1 ABC-type transport system permease [Haloferax mediterranei ATCC 33500]MDX5989315.1 ABC transporter permease [Haloferax mediterranei ATCC 33500]QCQ75682.1 ABC transporter permease [Haloferax mediterranei ATCC 33500]